jgi:hypothetical protein
VAPRSLAWQTGVNKAIKWEEIMKAFFRLLALSAAVSTLLVPVGVTRAQL